MEYKYSGPPPLYTPECTCHHCNETVTNLHLSFGTRIPTVASITALAIFPSPPSKDPIVLNNTMCSIHWEHSVSSSGHRVLHRKVRQTRNKSQPQSSVETVKSTSTKSTSVKALLSVLFCEGSHLALPKNKPTSSLLLLLVLG